MTSRTTADLAAKAKGDKSMLITQEVEEDMYAKVLQVLCAGLDWDCRIRVPSDDVHIRHTMSLRGDAEIRQGGRAWWNALVSEGQAMSEGSEQKETYTHSPFHMRKRGIAYPSRDARRRNPHSSWLVQRRGSPRKRARARP